MQYFFIQNTVDFGKKSKFEIAHEFPKQVMAGFKANAEIIKNFRIFGRNFRIFKTAVFSIKNDVYRLNYFCWFSALERMKFGL